MKELKFTQ